MNQLLKGHFSPAPPIILVIQRLEDPTIAEETNVTLVMATVLLVRIIFQAETRDERSRGGLALVQTTATEPRDLMIGPEP